LRIAGSAIWTTDRRKPAKGSVAAASNPGSQRAPWGAGECTRMPSCPRTWRYRIMASQRPASHQARQPDPVRYPVETAARQATLPRSQDGSARDRGPARRARAKNHRRSGRRQRGAPDLGPACRPGYL